MTTRLSDSAAFVLAVAIYTPVLVWQRVAGAVGRWVR